MFSFPDKLFCEWPQRVSPSRYLLPFPYRLFVSHPPTLVPSLPARGICSKTLAHEEREAPQFNWQAPCKAALFHYKLSQQAVRQISCIIEPTEQQGQARSRACGDVACKCTDHNIVTKRFSPRSSGMAVLQYEVMAESYCTDPKVCDKVFSDGTSQGFKVLANCWLASTSHYMVSFVVAGLSLLVIERSSTVLPKQTAIVRVPMSFKIKNDFILFLEYDDNIPLWIIISSLLLPLILCHININYLKAMFFGYGTVFSKTNLKSI